jgi:hypothetical protein
MRIFKYILLLFVLSSEYGKLEAEELFYGIGLNYLSPISHFEKNDKSAYGARAEIFDKTSPKWQYGLELDYFSIDKKKDTNLLYYPKAYLLSPTLRWLPFAKAGYGSSIDPYLKGAITFSVIDGSDDASDFGCGLNLGVGAIYQFRLFDYC